MKFAALSLAACAALALSVGTASAQPWGHHGHHGGYHHGYTGGYRGFSYGYPAYNYSSYGYNSGFGLSINRPGFNLSIGNGVSPYYNYSSFGYPSYGYSPYGYGGYGWGW